MVRPAGNSSQNTGSTMQESGPLAEDPSPLAHLAATHQDLVVGEILARLDPVSLASAGAASKGLRGAARSVWRARTCEPDQVLQTPLLSRRFLADVKRSPIQRAMRKGGAAAARSLSLPPMASALPQAVRAFFHIPKITVAQIHEQQRKAREAEGLIEVTAEERKARQAQEIVRDGARAKHPGEVAAHSAEEIEDAQRTIILFETRAARQRHELQRALSANIAQHQWKQVKRIITQLGPPDSLPTLRPHQITAAAKAALSQGEYRIVDMLLTCGAQLPKKLLDKAFVAASQQKNTDFGYLVPGHFQLPDKVDSWQYLIEHAFSSRRWAAFYLAEPRPEVPNNLQALLGDLTDRLDAAAAAPPGPAARTACWAAYDELAVILRSFDRVDLSELPETLQKKAAAACVIADLLKHANYLLGRRDMMRPEDADRYQGLGHVARFAQMTAYLHRKALETLPLRDALIRKVRDAANAGRWEDVLSGKNMDILKAADPLLEKRIGTAFIQALRQSDWPLVRRLAPFYQPHAGFRLAEQENLSLQAVALSDADQRKVDGFLHTSIEQGSWADVGLALDINGSPVSVNESLTTARSKLKARSKAAIETGDMQEIELMVTSLPAAWLSSDLPWEKVTSKIFQGYDGASAAALRKLIVDIVESAASSGDWNKVARFLKRSAPLTEHCDTQLAVQRAEAKRTGNTELQQQLKRVQLRFWIRGTTPEAS